MNTCIPVARYAPVLFSCLLICGCQGGKEGPAPEDWVEDFPVGELDESDLKADGAWGAATTCKGIPDLPVLNKPAISLSLEGLTLHLVDREGDYDRVFPIGVGTINNNPSERSYGESRSMYPLLATGSQEFQIDTGNATTFASCAIWWHDKDSGADLPVFAGLPFMRWYGSYGIHGPITGYTQANGGYLKRGFVSHGCVRMEAADVKEVYARIRGRGKVPVHVQREPERRSDGSRVDVEQNWVGSECQTDADCRFTGGRCDSNPVGLRGFCTRSCDAFCSDRTGYPVTFCAPDPAHSPGGRCVLKESSLNQDCRTTDHLVPATAQRNGQPDVQARVCLPGSRGWVGDRCLVPGDCKLGNRCQGARPGQSGLCTRDCERYCPDQPGRPLTFCVDEPEFDGPTCTRTCDPDHNAPECPAWTECVARERAGSGDGERPVCLPLDQGEDQPLPTRRFNPQDPTPIPVR